MSLSLSLHSALHVADVWRNRVLSILHPVDTHGGCKFPKCAGVLIPLLIQDAARMLGSVILTNFAVHTVLYRKIVVEELGVVDVDQHHS